MINMVSMINMINMVSMIRYKPRPWVEVPVSLSTWPTEILKIVVMMMVLRRMVMVLRGSSLEDHNGYEEEDDFGDDIIPWEPQRASTHWGRPSRCWR